MYLANVIASLFEATQTVKMNSKAQKLVDERFEQISDAFEKLEAVKSQLQEKLAVLQPIIGDAKGKLDQMRIHYGRSRS